MCYEGNLNIRNIEGRRTVHKNSDTDLSVEPAPGQYRPTRQDEESRPSHHFFDPTFRTHFSDSRGMTWARPSVEIYKNIYSWGKNCKLHI